MDGDSYRAQQSAWPAGRTESEDERREDRTAAPATDRFNAHAILQALARHEAAQSTSHEDAYDDVEDQDAEEDAVAMALEDTDLDEDEMDGSVTSGYLEDPAAAWADDGMDDDSEDAPAEPMAATEHVDAFAELALEEDFLADVEDDATVEADEAKTDMWAGDDDGMDPEADHEDDFAETPSPVSFDTEDNVSHTEEDEGEDGLLFGEAEDEDVADENGSLLGEVESEDDEGEDGILLARHEDESEGEDIASDEFIATASEHQAVTGEIPLFDTDAEGDEVVATSEPFERVDDAATMDDVAAGSSETGAGESDDLASIIGALGLGAVTHDAAEEPEAETLEASSEDESPHAATFDWPDNAETDGADEDSGSEAPEETGLSFAVIASVTDEDEPVDEVTEDEGLVAGMMAADLASDEPEEDDTHVAPGAMAFAAVASDQVFASIDDPDLPGRKPRIALMGEFSAGKSTLSNLLIGASPLPTRVTATQLPPVWISWGEGQAYREDLDGTTHAIDVERIGEIDPSRTRVIRLFCQSDILELCDIIDMPGISDPNMSSEVWERVIGKADGVIWCTHATQAWRQSEAAVWESLNPALFAKSLLLITRFDKLRTEVDRARVLKRIERETKNLFAARLPISLVGALGARDDAEKWEQSGAADFTDRLVTLLRDLSSSLGSKSDDRMERPLDDASGERSTARRPRSVQVHRPRTETLAAPIRVMPRRVRPAADGGRQDAHP